MVVRLLLLLLLSGAVAHAEIQGRVVDTDGNPVADAEVFSVLRAPDGAGERKLWRASTDADGRFTFEPYVRFHGFFFVRAPGMALAAAQARPPSYGTLIGPLYDERRSKMTLKLDIRLRPERLVVGRILDPDGRPLPGTTVQVVAVRTEATLPSWSDLPPELADRHATRTDAGGVYRLSGIYPTRTRLAVEAAGMATRLIELSGNPADERMEPACRIRGRLLNGDIPLAGWVIGADSSSHSARMHSFDTEAPTPGSGRAITDADGRFELDGLPPDEYQVRPTGAKDATRKVAVVGVSVSADQPEGEVLLRATAGAVITGRVVNPDTGHPVERPRVWVSAPDHPQWPGHHGGGYAQSLPDGRFRAWVAPGKVQLWPDGSRGRDEDAIVVTVAEGQEVEVALQSRQTHALAGTVFGPDGKAAGGTRLIMRGRGYWEDKETWAALDGSFRFEGLPDWGVGLAVVPRQDGTGLPVPVRLKPPFPKDLRVDLVPLPRVVITGRVVDDRGRPVPGARLRLVHVTPAPGEDRRDDVAYGQSGADGSYRFSVRDLSGDYEVTTSHPGSARALSGGKPKGETGAERHLTDLVAVPFTMPASAPPGSARGALTSTVTGQVLGSDGKPVEGALVRWVSGDGHLHRVKSDADGRFSLSRLPNRTVLLFAWHDKHGSALAQTAPGKPAILRLKQ